MVGETAEAAVARLSAELDRTLAALLPRGTRAALINYPNHHNVGDPALYLGGLAALRRIGVRLTYRCHHSTYSRQSLARELRRGTEQILISGGGSLGDQYPPHATRERILSDFPGVRTIQLPQSLWFTERANLQRFAEVVSKHRDLTLLWRDRDSHETARRHLDSASALCPDLAFGLGPLRRPVEASQDVVWLRRADRESPDPETPRREVDGVKPVDWFDASTYEALGSPFGVRLLRANLWLTGHVERAPWLWRPLARTFAPLARRRLEYGCRLLGRGRVVVTDRLHGVLIALLMGIPVVAVDNRNHKVSSFIATWLQDVEDVQLVGTHEEALRVARGVLRSNSF